MARTFRDRRSAGRALGEALSAVEDLRGRPVIGLLRGGVPVAEPVAAALGSELLALSVRRGADSLGLGSDAIAKVRGGLVVVVGDGMATAAPMREAVSVVRDLGVRRVLVAVPVAAQRAIDELGSIADHVVCPVVPDPLGSIGSWYADFRRVDDSELGAVLGRAAAIEGRGAMNHMDRRY